MLLHGIFPPLTTPFYPDGNVYFKKIEHNVERYSKTPVAGLVILGSTGEAVMLSDDERREVLKNGPPSKAVQMQSGQPQAGQHGNGGPSPAILLEQKRQ